MLFCNKIKNLRYLSFNDLKKSNKLIIFTEYMLFLYTVY